MHDAACCMNVGYRGDAVYQVNGGLHVTPLTEPNAPLFKAVKLGRNHGQALDRGQFYALFKQYAKQVGLPSSNTPHSARGTFITQAYEPGLQRDGI